MQYIIIILCIRQAGITVIWLVMLIVKGSGLSRRVVRNRGSIDSGREEGRNRCSQRVNHKRRRQYYVLAEIRAHDLLKW